MDFSTWTDSDLRAVCRANDANGDFDDCTRADLVAILTGWIAEEPDYWRAALGCIRKMTIFGGRMGGA